MISALLAIVVTQLVQVVAFVLMELYLKMEYAFILIPVLVSNNYVKQKHLRCKKCDTNQKLYMIKC